jgi:hypothetical protein
MITSAEEFIILIESNDPDIRSRSLTDTASTQVWENIILNHKDYEIFILDNITTPMCILEQLAVSSNWRTRHAVARKRRASAPILQLLSRDDEPLVRQAVAANQKTPIAILSFLTEDEDERVKRVARFNLDNCRK